MKILYPKFFFLILSIFFTGIIFPQWQPDVRLTNNSAVSQTCENNAWGIAASGDTVHAAWWDERDGNYEIYYKRSTNKGLTWGSDMRLTNSSGYSGHISIAVSGTVVHLVWDDDRDGNYEIYYKRSGNAGSTWGSDIRLTNNPAWSVLPSLCVLGNAVHVVWADERDADMEIYYKRSTDAGVSWGGDLRITTSNGYSYQPSVSASAQYVHVAWWDMRSNDREIFYKRSYDGGSAWSSDLRMTYDPAESNWPSVAANGLNIHVVWDDERDGNREIYYKQSTNGGGIWSPDTRLTNNPGTSVGPSLCISGSILHVVFEDTRDGNYEIYYKRSTNGGLSWEADTRLTNNPGWSPNPSVTVSGTAVHVIWHDNRDGNWEIYYKQDPTGNPLPPSAPVLISPANGSQGQSITPLLDWTPVNGAAGYRVQVTTDSTFTLINSLDSSIAVRDSLRIPSGRLNNNVKYFWRVNAANTAGTGPWSVIWNFRVGYIGTEQTGNEIPAELKLYNNYPNPFNPVTKIKFEIPKLSNVKIIIYDVLGREIASILPPLRGGQEGLQPGTYEIDFDGSDYASGIYYYSIKTGTFSQTKRMVLIK